VIAVGLILQDSLKMRGWSALWVITSTIFEGVNHVIQEAAKIRILIYEKCDFIRDRATVRSKNQEG
jgi:hypothetical protein